MSKGQNLYTQVVEVSEEFLGPAGERFIRRQVETHLAITPESIKPQHLPELVEWLRLMFNMITNDAAIVDDFANKLLKLSKNHSAKSFSDRGAQ